MARQTKKRNLKRDSRADSGSPENASASNDEHGPDPSKGEPDLSRRGPDQLSKSWKRGLSVILLAYLLIVVLGPLANPVGSEFLTRPLARAVAPFHRALFLGHGYRFFGPDPGPSHIVVYRVSDSEGHLVEGKFPDRDRHWPRLLYHRWFMLSETLFNEHILTPDEESFEASDAELADQIKVLRSKGKFELAGRLSFERHRIREQFEDAQKRIDNLVAAIARHLMKSNDGHHVEIFMQERNMPFSIQVLTGSQLDEDQFLSPLRKIGEFLVEDTGEVVSLEIVPEPLEEEQ